jgi:hypothetical protein
LIMQLLRDNLTLWTSELPEDGNAVWKIMSILLFLCELFYI